MRKLLATLGTLALLSSPLALAGENTLCSNCMTGEDDPVGMQEVALFPVRLTTATVGVPIGAMAGIGNSVDTSVTAVANATFAKIPTDEHDSSIQNATATLLKLPVYGSIGLVGTAIAIPVSAVYGAVTGSVQGFADGYNYID